MRKYKNPIIEGEMKNKAGGAYDKRTADPYVIRYNNMYYHCYAKDDGVYITEAKELCDIGMGRKTKVYDSEPGFVDWYAPELHRIDGVWYIYGAPGVNDDGMHCMCVLENRNDNPIGNYKNKGIVCGLEDKWNIDGTILKYNGMNIFLWSDCGRIYMSEMNSPYSITEKVIDFGPVKYDFEMRCGKVIEGPAVLKRRDKIHIVYSANDSKSEEYCLGMMTFSGGDIFDTDNWVRCKTAVFEKTDKIFGPGHCSFTTVTENGKEVDYIVYHANLEPNSGWGGRSVWIQSFTWNEDDMPVFGKPNFGTADM